jgi:hypothetical protein
LTSNNFTSYILLSLFFSLSACSLQHQCKHSLTNTEIVWKNICLPQTNERRQIKRTGYGVALPKGSPWRDKISLAILELQEKGTIQILYDKWWKNTGEICSRDEKNKESKANALGA